MNWYTFVAIFIVIWWVCLFVVLPFGVRTQDEEGTTVPGTTGSAPARPMLVRKLLITTALAAVVFGVLWFAYAQLGFDLEWMADRFG